VGGLLRRPFKCVNACKTFLTLEGGEDRVFVEGVGGHLCRYAYMHIYIYVYMHICIQRWDGRIITYVGFIYEYMGVVTYADVVTYVHNIKNHT
jgi:hypothetical protein